LLAQVLSRQNLRRRQEIACSLGAAGSRVAGRKPVQEVADRLAPGAGSFLLSFVRDTAAGGWCEPESTAGRRRATMR
jgi:hypothetical protein